MTYRVSDNKRKITKSIALEMDVWKLVEVLAKRAGKSISAYINDLIKGVK